MRQKPLHAVNMIQQEERDIQQRRLERKRIRITACHLAGKRKHDGFETIVADKLDSSPRNKTCWTPRPDSDTSCLKETITKWDGPISPNSKGYLLID